MTLLQLIAKIEKDYPEYRWLVRSVDADEKHISGKYLANVSRLIGPHNFESHKCAAPTAAAALSGAFQHMLNSKARLQ